MTVSYRCPYYHVLNTELLAMIFTFLLFVISLALFTLITLSVSHISPLPTFRSLGPCLA